MRYQWESGLDECFGSINITDDSYESSWLVTKSDLLKEVKRSFTSLGVSFAKEMTHQN